MTEIQSNPSEFGREDERGYPRLMIECAADDPRVAGWRDVCVQFRRPFAILSRKPGGYASCHVDIEPMRYQWRRETIRLHPALLREAREILALVVRESDHPLALYECSDSTVHAEFLSADLAKEFTNWLAIQAFCHGGNQGIIRDVVPLATVIDLDSRRKPRTSLRERVSDIDGGPIDWGDVS